MIIKKYYAKDPEQFKLLKTTNEYLLKYNMLILKIKQFKTLRLYMYIQRQKKINYANYFTKKNI